jgi:hypothetical protein
MIRTELALLIPPAILRQVADAIEKVADPGPAFQTVDLSLDKNGATTIRFLNPACPMVQEKVAARQQAREPEPTIIVAPAEVLKKLN